MPRRSAALLALVASLLLAACGSAAGAGRRPPPLPAGAAKAHGSHVVVIVMENKEYGDVVGSHDAPYFNRLARRYASLDRLYATRHPSLPNYLALTGGSTFGIDTDCTDCSVHAHNLVDQLEAHHRSWTAYMEGMPHPCFTGVSAGRYAKKHDPFMYYDDVRGNPARCRHIVPLTRLRGDLRRGHLPDFAWISPDLCHDMHDCPVSDGDRFLAATVPALLRALGPRGMLVVTWDEGSSDAACCGQRGGGHIPTVIAGPGVRRHLRYARPASQLSLLRTIEHALGMRALRGAAAPSTPSLHGVFRRRPR